MNKLVLLIQQFSICADEVEVVLWCDVVDSSQLLQELLAILPHTEVHRDHMVHHRLAMFIWNLVILRKRNEVNMLLTKLRILR